MAGRANTLFGSFAQNFYGPNAELFISSPGGGGLWDYDEVNPPKGYPNDLGLFPERFRTG